MSAFRDGQRKEERFDFGFDGLTKLDELTAEPSSPVCCDVLEANEADSASLFSLLSSADAADAALACETSVPSREAERHSAKRLGLLELLLEDRKLKREGGVELLGAASPRWLTASDDALGCKGMMMSSSQSVEALAVLE